VYADESLRFCLDDGASLVAAVPPGAQETLRINPPRLTRAKPTEVLPGSSLTPPDQKHSLIPWLVTGAALFLVAVMGIVITIVIFANRQSTSPNSNGSNAGRNANSTPTPRAAPVVDLTGTKWTQLSTTSQIKEFNFLPNGTINNDSGDTWKQNGNKLTMSITNGYAIYEGAIYGDRIDYKAHNKVNLDWTGTLWRVRQSSTP
jgi:heme/copper-type cytochrome/quinol oxidase subunit 2